MKHAPIQKQNTHDQQYAFTFCLGAVGVFHRQFELLYELAAIHTPLLPDVQQSFQGLLAALICLSVQRLGNHYSSADQHSLCFQRASSKLAAAPIAICEHLERILLILSETKHTCSQFSPLFDLKIAWKCLTFPPQSKGRKSCERRNLLSFRFCNKSL